MLSSAPLLASPSVSIAQAAEIPKGQVVEKLVCANSPDQSYALYLPSNYSAEKKWPVLYAFDPRARGKLAAERFSDAAEKFGWIIVASNNSRNGALQPSIDAWNAIVKDTHARFTIDDERVYVAGFSGGARMAIYFASHCSDCVAGVIACSAGFPAGMTPSRAWHFSLFLTAGVEDFNFAEVKGTEEPLTRAGVTHRIEVFTGRHEWPPSPVTVEAFEWMELQAMKTGKRQRDANLIESIWQRKLREANALEDTKQIYEAFRTYLALTDSFKTLRDIAEIERTLSQLRDSPIIRDAVRDEQQQIRKQRDLETRISAFLAAGDGSTEAGSDDRARPSERLDPDTRLQGMFADLRKRADQKEDTADRRVARRVLDGTFITLMEQGLSLLETQKRYTAALRTFQLATEVNPERAGAFFYLGWAYAANRDRQKAVRALRTAVDKGFSDLAAITGNKAFDAIRDDAQYLQLIQGLQNKR